MTKPTLNEIRDELAREELGDHCWPYIRGFDAGVAEMKSRAQVLVDALNKLHGASMKSASIVWPALEEYRKSVDEPINKTSKEG